MKNRKCPHHKNCWDYGNCESCEVGKSINGLHRKIDRLKTENLKLKVENEELKSRIDVLLNPTEDNKWCSKRILETDKTIAELRKNTDEIAKTLPMAKKEIQADTVRKMQEALEHRIHSKLSYHGWYLKKR